MHAPPFGIDICIWQNICIHLLHGKTVGNKVLEVSDKQVQQLFRLPHTGIRIRDKTSTFDGSKIRMFKSLSLNLVICMHLFESDIQTDLTHAIISQKIVQSGLRFKPWVFPWRNAQTMLHAFLCRVKREKWIATFGYRHSSEIATRDLGHTLGKCLNRLNNGADFECPRNCPCAVVRNKMEQTSVVRLSCLHSEKNKTYLNIKAKFKKKLHSSHS